jgi:hypothetical protein
MHALSADHIETVDAFASLALPEQLLIGGVRAWVACCRAETCPMAVLRTTFGRFGAIDAAASVDAFMSCAVRTAIRCIEVRCPRCPGLTDDELRLLHAAAAAQQHDLAEARTDLEHWLPERAAYWALGPLCGFGSLLAQAGLFLPRPTQIEVNGHPARRCTLH